VRHCVAAQAAADAATVQLSDVCGRGVLQVPGVVRLERWLC